MMGTEEDILDRDFAAARADERRKTWLAAADMAELSAGYSSNPDEQDYLRNFAARLRARAEGKE